MRCYFVAQIVAVRGDLVRAVEIGATARQASIWEGSLTYDLLFMEPLEKLTAEMPPEVAAEAEAKDVPRDLFETVAQLLEEVQDPSWRWR